MTVREVPADTTAGLTRFDSTNEVKDCILVLGAHADRRPTILSHLLNDFEWKEVKHLQP